LLAEILDMPFDAAAFKAVFDAKPGEPLKTDRQINRVRYSRCGQFLLAAGQDARLHRWQIREGAVAALPPLEGHQGWVQSLVCLAGEPRVVSMDSWGQLRCSRIDGEPVESIWTVPAAHDGWILDVAVAPDNESLATCGADGLIRVWSTSRGELQGELPRQDAEVFCVNWSADGRSIFSGDLLGRVKQWSVSDSTVIREFGASSLHLNHRLQEVGGARIIQIADEGRTLLVAGTKPKNGGNVQGVPTVLVYDVPTGLLRQTIELGKDGDVYVTDLLALGDGAWLATISGNPGVGKIVAFHPSESRPWFETTKFPNCHSLALHSDKRRLAVSATNTGSNGNGRPINKNGQYMGNHSPIYQFTLPTT
jgi:WD40 repeat protein